MNTFSFVIEKKFRDEREVKKHISLQRNVMKIFFVETMGSTITNNLEAFQPLEN